MISLSHPQVAIVGLLIDGFNEKKLETPRIIAGLHEFVFERLDQIALKLRHIMAKFLP